MDNKLTETLRTWVAPRLMRLNQADGTDKHVLNFAESYYPATGTTCGGGYATGSGGAGNVCGGPS